MFLKVDIAQVQDGRENSKDGRLVVRGKVEDLHGSKQTQEVFCIILSCYSTIPSLYRAGEKVYMYSFFFSASQVIHHPIRINICELNERINTLRQIPSSPG